jgi:hypothetical protein
MLIDLTLSPIQRMLATRFPLPRGHVLVGQVEHPSDGERGLLMHNSSTGSYAMYARGALRTLDNRKIRAALKEAGADPNDPPELDLASTETDKAELANLLKDWRVKTDTSVQLAETVLGIPARTIEGIEQGRGFRYPRLIVLALQALE